MRSGRQWYSEKLKDPRWQKKRLEVLNAAEFRCERCGAEDRTLHVHHTYYSSGLMPWEYETWSLYALCEGCHELVPQIVQGLTRVSLFEFEAPDADTIDVIADAFPGAGGSRALRIWHDQPGYVLDIRPLIQTRHVA